MANKRNPLMANFRQLWDASSEEYDKYASAFPQYSDTNRSIVELAGIVPGQVVVDLACGTGLTASAIGVKLAGTGKLYCLDFSEDMLEKAKRNVISGNIEFIAAPAEEIANRIPEPVDRIICNAAFWQFTDKKAVLDGISRILKPDGHFVFNLPQQFYEMEGESHRGDIVKAIFDELRKRGYGPEGSMPPRFSESTLRELVSGHGLRVERIHIDEFEGTTLDDGIAFFRIPAVAPFFEGVPEAVKDDILRAVRERLVDSYQITPNRWAYVVVGNQM